MTEKSKILNFIRKYNLDANISGRVDNKIRLESTGSEIKTSFITEDLTLMGVVQINDIEFPVGEFGIYETTKLENLVKILQNDFDASVVEEHGKITGLKLTDDNYKMQFALAELDLIDQPPSLNEIPSGDIELNFNALFVEKYTKARRALTDSKTIAFVNNKGKLRLVVNYSTTNSNNIAIDFDTDVPVSFNQILFDGNQFLDILNSNKDATDSHIAISTSGILIATFSADDFNSKYYLVAGQEEND